jgi:hypothetical protein
MDADTRSAITVLQSRIRSKEEDVIRLKRTVNEIYVDAGEEAPYPNISSAEMASDLSSLRSDLFYGQTISGAAKAYLEIRKSAGQGAASVNEIYAALKKGGFPFEAKDDENAKNGLRVSLRKNSSIFHRLPGSGDYGLLTWYEKPKAAKNGDNEDKASSRKATKKPGPNKKAAKPKAKKNSNHPKEEEIPF